MFIKYFYSKSVYPSKIKFFIFRFSVQYKLYWRDIISDYRGCIISDYRD